MLQIGNSFLSKFLILQLHQVNTSYDMTCTIFTCTVNRICKRTIEYELFAFSLCSHIGAKWIDIIKHWVYRTKNLFVSVLLCYLFNSSIIVQQIHVHMYVVQFYEFNTYYSHNQPDIVLNSRNCSTLTTCLHMYVKCTLLFINLEHARIEKGFQTNDFSK